MALGEDGLFVALLVEGVQKPDSAITQPHLWAETTVLDLLLRPVMIMVALVSYTHYIDLFYMLGYTRTTHTHIYIYI